MKKATLIHSSYDLSATITITRDGIRRDYHVSSTSISREYMWDIAKRNNMTLVRFFASFCYCFTYKEL